MAAVGVESMAFFGRPSEEQRCLMIKLLQANQAAATGQCVGMTSRKEHEKFWADATLQLNSCNPAHSKSKEKWQKTWVDWKHLIKQKVSRIRDYQKGTVGGPPPRHLTFLEEEVLKLIGVFDVRGLNTGNSSKPLQTMSFYGRPSEEQRFLMIELLQTNQAAATGMRSRKKHDKFWTHATIQLNACNPAHSKSKEKWQKTWVDWKQFVKHKASRIRDYQKGTREGPPPKHLKGLEKKVLKLIGKVARRGLNIGESLEPPQTVDPTPGGYEHDETESLSSRTASPPHRQSSWDEDEIHGVSCETEDPLQQGNWEEVPSAKRLRRTSSSDLPSSQQNKNQSLRTMNESLSTMASAMSSMRSDMSALVSAVSTMASALSTIANAVSDNATA